MTRLCGLLPVTDQDIAAAVQAAAGVCGLVSANVHVVICDDDEIAGVHGEFFDDPSPTDVITFPIEGEGTAELPLIGELLVSAETALRVAAEQDHPAQTELLLYAIHGVLHLGGYDDQDAVSRSEMRSAEQQALQSLGRQLHYFE